MKHSLSPPPLPSSPPPRGVPAFNRSSRSRLEPSSASLVIRNGAQESLATPPHSTSTGPGEPMATSSTSAESYREEPPPLPPRTRFGFASAIALPRKPPEAPSDSDDQPVFSEVSLPDYRPSEPKRRSVRRSGRASGTASPTDPYVQAKFGNYHVVPQPMAVTPLSPASSKSSILERLGIKKKSSGEKSREKSLSESLTQSLHSEIESPASTLTRNCSAKSSPEKIGKSSTVKRALIKKRKRKISESDSVASSDASGKPYTIIDFQEAPDNQCGAGNLSPESSANLQKWNAAQKQKHKQKLQTELSQKGQSVKKSWLRKPKQQRVEDAPTSSTETNLRYFDRSAEGATIFDQYGRQDTVIYREIDDLPYPDGKISNLPPVTVSHAASDSNIKDLENSCQQSQKGRPGEAKSLSVTLNEQDDVSTNTTTLKPPSSYGDSVSLANASLLTASDDSVFASQEILEESGRGLVSHLLSLQEKNSVLLRKLRDKSREYEQITEQLSALEKEVNNLKGKYKYDETVEKIAAERTERTVPEEMIIDLEIKLKDMDESLRLFKNESFRTQQDLLESYVKEQATSQKNLDFIERLQKTNFMLLQRQMSELSLYDCEMRRKLELMPTYDALYSFAINIIRKLKQLQGQLLEKSTASSRLDFELLQTQSSLLLSHAQIERQKLELRALGVKLTTKKSHSFHGLDLANRVINEELNFYLPFKLHGSRIPKPENRQFLPLFNEDPLETEFLHMFDSARQASGKAKDLDYHPVRDLPHVSQWPTARSTFLPNSRFSHPSASGVFRPPFVGQSHVMPQPLSTASNWPVLGRRPISWTQSTEVTPPVSRKPRMDHAESEVKQIAEEISKSGRFGGCRDPPSRILPKQVSDSQRPGYAQRAPYPMRLGNVGQVKAIAAAFDVSSAPNSPLSKAAPHLLHAGLSGNSPRRAGRKPVSAWASSSSGSDRHYDTPASSASNSNGYSNIREKTASPGKVSGKNYSYSVTKIPTKGSAALAGGRGSAIADKFSVSPTPSQQSEPHYETLTLPAKYALAHRHDGLAPPDPMNKSSTPDSVSSGASASGMARLNEIRRKQFFFGKPSDSQQMSSSQPARMKSSFSKLAPQSKAVSLEQTSQRELASKAAQSTRSKSAAAAATVAPPSGEKKRSSWIMKLRNKK